jgi:N utilization substance protein A
VRRLFELEVPEINNGIVEIKAVAREAGFRSKVAVAAQQEGIDPVGSCVGLRGVRIQNVVNELGGERIDVIQWHAQSKVFIANALSPAQVVGVDIDEAEKSAVVVVPDGQLSLAIGKEGQNARLAAKLTGWKIDIKSQSVAEAEKKTRVKEAPPAAEEPAKVEEQVTQGKERVARVKEPVPLEKEGLAVSEGVAQVEGAVALPQKVEEEVEVVVPYEPPSEVEVPAVKPQIRFAEDIFAPKAPKPDVKKKDKKKKTFKEDKLESGKAKRARKHKVPALDELEEDLEA